MKKTALVLLSILFLYSPAKADEYTDCLTNSGGDLGIIDCNNAQTTSTLRKLQSRYGVISSNKYFGLWNDKTLSSQQNFQLLFRQWIEYRDKYCSLYGYSFSQGQGTLGNVQKSQCMLDLTNRFSKDIESIINIYNDMAVKQ